MLNFTAQYHVFHSSIHSFFYIFLHWFVVVFFLLFVVVVIILSTFQSSPKLWFDWISLAENFPRKQLKTLKIKQIWKNVLSRVRRGFYIREEEKKKFKFYYQNGNLFKMNLLKHEIIFLPVCLSLFLPL